LEGTLKNRDLLQLGLEELSFPSPDLDNVGQLLTNHHGVLRDTLGVSTPKIERMLSAALDAGAMGGKINGTGGGGCMFVLAPKNPVTIARAIEQQGGVAHIIEMDEGTAYE
jgi:galactokinase